MDVLKSQSSVMPRAGGFEQRKKVRRYALRALSVALACLIVCELAPQFSCAQSAELSGWDNVWSDDFNGSSIDYSRWEVADREFSPNNELQYYRPEQVSVGGGQLKITATNQPLGSKPYRSGLIRTWQEHRFGRWEVRADLPWGQGMWPAIWLLPRNADWPVGGEIDIMENVGNNTYFVKGSYHYNWTPGSPITSNNDYITGEDFAAGMHKYAVEWDPSQIRFYVDDNLYHVVQDPIQPAEVPMSLIINLAVGGDWPGSPDGSTVFPQTFDVDYARYWTRDESELINPDFDRSGWGLNGWSAFGNAIDNVTAQSEAVLDGTHSLKLFGQYNGAENFSGVFQGIAVEPGQNISADASAFIRSQDSIFGTSNEAIMKLEYYTSFGADYGSADFLGEVPLVIADGSSAENIWADHQLLDVVPEGAVEARVTFLFRQPGEEGGAVHIDNVSLIASDPVNTDLNGDGYTDGVDLGRLLGNWNASAPPSGGELNGTAPIDGLDLGILLGGWDPPPLAAVQAVPEPTALLLSLVSLGIVLLRRDS